MKTIGEKAKEFREAKKWNATKMAKEVGTSRQNIEHLEARGGITPHYVAGLARVMGTTVDDLITGHATANITAPMATVEATAGHTPPADYSPEALILARWLDKLPADSDVKDQAFKACLEILGAAGRSRPPQTPAPAPVRQQGKQSV